MAPVAQVDHQTVGEEEVVILHMAAHGPVHRGVVVTQVIMDKHTMNRGVMVQGNVPFGVGHAVAVSQLDGHSKLLRVAVSLDKHSQVWRVAIWQLDKYR